MASFFSEKPLETVTDSIKFRSW